MTPEVFPWNLPDFGRCLGPFVRQLSQKIKMKLSRFFPSLLSLAMVTTLVPGMVRAQDTVEDVTSEVMSVSQDSILSMEGGNRLLDRAAAAIERLDYETAVTELQNARKVFNQLSNFHVKLAGSFQGIDNGIYDRHRRQAFESGQKRDETTYQLAIVHRSQGQAELAVPLLIQIIESQTPTSELGEKAYQQLQEIGFAPMDGDS